MIKVGLESIIQAQLNDEVINDISIVYDKLRKVGTLYYRKKSIDKKELTNDLKNINEMFNKMLKKRFNLNINLRNSNTFAVFPIFNTKQIKSNFSMNDLSKDVNKASKQLVKFEKYIEKNRIDIDLKECKINGLSDDYSFTLLVSLRSMSMDVTKDDFIAIILHEIGHIFTLLEMYADTNKSISSLLNGLLLNDADVVVNELVITGDKQLNSKDGITKVYSKLTSKFDGILLTSGRETDDTDVEYEADSFVSKFGYGAQLTKTLNKLSKTKELSYENFLILGMFIWLINTIIITLILFITASPLYIFNLVLFSFIGTIIGNTNRFIQLQQHRNYSNDEHGTLSERFVKIRTSIIFMLRTSNLDKDEIKVLLKDIEDIDNEIKILDKSFMNSFFGSFLHSTLGSNLNISDNLGATLDSLINNDIYLSSAKFTVGLEHRNYIKDVDKYYTDINIPDNNTGFYNTFIANAFKNKNIIKPINDILKTYDMEIMYNKEDSILAIMSSHLLQMRRGIAGFALVPVLKDRKDMTNTSVVSLTLEADKVLWQIFNPRIKVYRVDVVPINNEKVLYILEIEYLKRPSEKEYKQLNVHTEILQKVYIDYGELGSVDVIEKTLQLGKKKLTKSVNQELTLLLDYLKTNYNHYDTSPSIDTHTGNWGVNMHNDVILIDPIYNSRKLALKESNIINIPYDKLDKKEDM